MADILPWAESNAIVNRFGTKEYSPFVCHIANLFDPRTHGACECRWVAPYGFVPKEGCPEHDR